MTEFETKALEVLDSIWVALDSIRSHTESTNKLQEEIHDMLSLMKNDVCEINENTLALLSDDINENTLALLSSDYD